jgi:sulfatase maturation enzyme AslB (radical SAM superfamily)
MTSFQELQIKPCCNITPISKSDSVFVGNLEKVESVKDVVNADILKTLRKDLIAGKLPANCIKCVSDESMRTHIKRYFVNDTELDEFIKSTAADGTVDQQKFKLKYFDFKFSNTCNLKCRMCKPCNSSAIQIEADGHNRNIKKIDNYKDLWEKHVDEHIDDVKCFYFAGGEPLMMKEHWYVLDKLDGRDVSDVILKYTTNASSLKYGNKNVLDYWAKFKKKNLKITLSLDDIGPRLEYQRGGANFDSTIRNMKIISEYLGRSSINCAFTAYNAFYIDEFVDFLDNNFVNVSLNLNYCFSPDFMAPTALPKELTEVVIEKLLSIKSKLKDGMYKNVAAILQIDECIKYISSSWSLYGSTDNFTERFVAETKRLDALRNESFAKTYPEIAGYFGDAFKEP